MARWVLQNGDTVGVPGVLMCIIVASAVALQRQWLVMGWIYKECIADRDRFEQRIESAAEKADAKVELALSKADAKIAELQAEVEASKARRR